MANDTQKGAPAAVRAVTGIFAQYRGLRKEVYVLFFGTIVTNLGSMIWPMLTMILSQKLGLDAGRISILMVAAGVLMMPASLVGGKLADRFNKKRIIICCDTVSVICCIAGGLIPLGYATVALIMVSGMLQNMEYASYSALFADLTATRDRARAFSLSYLGANLGLVLSPTIAGILFKDYLWLSFIISGVAIGISTLLIGLFVKDITPEPDESEQAEYQKSRASQSLKEVLHDNKLILVFLVMGSLYSAAYSQYNFLMPLEMGNVHGEDGALIFGTVSSLNCIVVVLFTPLITRIFRKMSETRRILTGLLMIAGGYLVFLLLLGIVPAYYAAMLLFTWGEIFFTISEGPYLTSRIPASHRGRINGLFSVVSMVMVGACELSVGHLYDAAGSLSAWVTVLGVLAAAVALTLVLVFRDRKTYPNLYISEEKKEK